MVVRTRNRKEDTQVRGRLRSGGCIATIMSFKQLKEEQVRIRDTTLVSTVYL